jgi:ubiquinone/menaquinone biosynthesis C-methylase UbiE
MWGEHRSRYHFAVPFVVGKRMLDIACGTGFGEQILIDGGAAEIIAADYSEEALITTSELRTAKTYTLRTDGTKLPFEDGTFGAITSFETVEHIPNYEEFVTELRRVLTEDGVLVMSTPNAKYTRPVNGIPKNPFHVYEFTPEEFEALLLSKFGTVELFGQRVSAARRICPYWELPDMLPTDAWSKVKIAIWKAHVRLPASLREGLSKLLSGRQYFPAEGDFVFERSELHTGYVQVAVCRP